jgi:hypothetical protein
MTEAGWILTAYLLNSLWNRSSRKTPPRQTGPEGTLRPAVRYLARPVTANVEETMATKTSSVTAKGKAAGRSLKSNARNEERLVEARKGSDLAKGEKRFEERSRSSDGKSPGAKQR